MRPGEGKDGKFKHEADLQRAIQLELCDRLDMMRNNVGVAKQDRRTVRYGVGGNGGADLIGIERGTGRFVAIETKSRNDTPRDTKRWRDQKIFRDRILRSGGIAMIVWTMDDVTQALEKAR